ncbi:MAG TPA: carboxypeptidase-like regulatory domain-containing protein [Candidatus Limnocylindrales bacterium]|nr:carboxypeptidase-like regulatory domain-containing protein [Candidatus Limnocylindrales bacterium]
MKAALVACLLTLGLSGCAGWWPGTAPAGTITGHVTIRVCGGPMPLDGEPSTTCVAHPMAGAIVIVRPVAGGAARTATTSASGAYTIAVQAGTYTVSVGHVQQTVTVTAGQSLTVDLSESIQLM